ncbi:MAG: Maf family protein, partial [Patescibacteria group bacterium]
AINTKTWKRAEGVDVVSLHFAPIPEDVIEKLISSGDIFTCAGGFSLEIAVLENLLGQIDGERESVIGMPKTLTERLIKEVS